MKTADKKVYAAVKERAIRTDIDGYEYIACEVCGSNGQKWKLEMHHKIHRSQLPKDEQTTIWNVILLCRKCHGKAHDLMIK